MAPKKSQQAPYMEALERVLKSYPIIDSGYAAKLVESWQAGRNLGPFAVVKFSGDHLTEKTIDDTARMYADLSLLLPTIVVHGSGEPLNERLGRTPKYRGIRPTRLEDMPIVVGVDTDLTLDLVNRINIYGGHAAAVIPTPTNPMFKFDRVESIKERDKWVYLWEVGFAPLGKEVRCMDENAAEYIRELLKKGFMPVISPIVHYKPGPLYNDPYKPLNPDADDIARVIARNINPHYVVFVTENADSPSIDLSQVEAYMKKRPPEGIREAFLQEQEHYRDAQWKIRAAIEMATNGNSVIAIVRKENLMSLLLSKEPRKFSDAIFRR